MPGSASACKKAARIIRAAWFGVTSKSPQVTDGDPFTGSFDFICQHNIFLVNHPMPQRRNRHKRSDYDRRPKEKTPASLETGVFNGEPDDVLLSLEIQPTIIGDKVFHGPVRNGKAWDHLSMVIRQRLCPQGTNTLQNQIVRCSDSSAS